jgi:hypothetical protein
VNENINILFFSAELENTRTGVPSVGKYTAHLEKNIFMSELMTASASGASVVYSPIHLAFMMDSGWYYVDYGGSERASWGNKQGCDFLFRTCDKWPQSSRDAGFFCLNQDVGCGGEDFNFLASCGNSDSLTGKCGQMTPFA